MEKCRPSGFFISSPAEQLPRPLWFALPNSGQRCLQSLNHLHLDSFVVRRVMVVSVWTQTVSP